MELRRAQLSGLGQGGYSRTTGDLLRYPTFDGAMAGIDRCREESYRAEWGHRHGWSEERCNAQNIYASPEHTLYSQERAVRGLQSDALYFGLGATAAARPLFHYLQTGELPLPEDRPGDPPAPSGAVASALNARLHRAGYGVATATRDRIVTRAAPRDVPAERFSLEGVRRPM